MQLQPPTHPLLASELFALAHSVRCVGPDRCHWCSAPCARMWKHNDPPPLIGVPRSLARCPGNGFICNGCWIWRRQRTTVFYLDHTFERPHFRDGQSLRYASVYCTEQGAWLVRDHEKEALYALLLDPPKRFFLSLLSAYGENHLQLAHTNDLPAIQADTPLTFTLDGIPHTYSVYELEMAAKHGPEGRLPGVQALARLFGPPPVSPAPEKRKVGRPAGEGDELQAVKAVRRYIKTSG